MTIFFVGQTVRSDAREVKSGALHITAAEPYTLGRMKRKAFAPLCKNKVPYDVWTVDEPATCSRCIETAERFGLVGFA